MKLKLARNQIIIIALGVFIVVLFLGIIVFFRRTPANSGLRSGNLTIWGVFDDAAVFRSVIEKYNQVQPNVKINYVQKNPLTYEQDVVNALATPNAPDIIMFHNTWLPKHADKIQPLVPSAMNIEEYRRLYPDVVVQDFAPDGVIYAAPLYVDTLALYYNNDIFDREGVALPPKNWKEFQDIIPKLRLINTRTGQIETAAAAIGGSEKSINRATDLISLLMLQDGTTMVGNNVHQPSFVSDEGAAAVDFYTNFANPKSPFYTWDEAFSYSIDGFAAEDVVMMFNYQHQEKLLKEKNPFLNFSIVPMLQPAQAERPVNYANYWGLAVPAKNKNWRLAWHFILDFMKSPELNEAYLNAANRPPALRSLINKYINDPALGVFARQALTARSWPQIDNNLTERAFSTMIGQVLGGRPAMQALIEARETLKKL